MPYRPLDFTERAKHHSAWSLPISPIVTSEREHFFRHDLGLLDMSEMPKVEPLFDDPLVVACGPRSPWARRRKINLAELVHEPWIMQARNTNNYIRLSEAFQASGLTAPRASLITASLPLVVHFL